MKCFGCYKADTTGYCLKCRKKLFKGKNISSILPFKAPKNENLVLFQENTKRLSISGVQLKYSLRLNEDKLELTENAGEYILKPIPPATLVENEQAPENEHLAMQIAEQVFKIPTAANALIYFEDGYPAYITKRFDIKPDGSKYLQEDFAQLSQKTKQTHGEHYKYDGTYEDIGHLIKNYVAAYAPAMELYFKTVLFNYLISNGDAHLKNFSLIQSETGEYLLTPAYDLMSTILHTPNETDTALDLFEGDINSEYYKKFGCFGFSDFMEFAKKLSIVELRAKRMINEMIGQQEKVSVMIRNSFLSDEAKIQFEKNFLEKVGRFGGVG